MKGIVIADDLTGANDTGVQFANMNMETLVFMDADPKNLTSYTSKDIWVFNSETRSLSSQKAYEKMASLGERLQVFETAIIYKKIDSTLRGNMGPEIDALLDSLGFEVAVVVPAYPENKRTTIEGYHYVDGQLVSESEISRDPKSPVKESYLPALLSRQTKRKVSHINLKSIRDGSLAQSLNQVQGDGAKIVVIDAEIDADLKTVAQVLMTGNKNVLWVGSAGLAKHLAILIQETSGSVGQTVLNAQTTHSKSVLVVAGSVSGVTRSQVEYLKEEGCHELIFDPIKLLEKKEADLEAYYHASKAILSAHENLVLTTDIRPEKHQEVALYLESHGMSRVDSGNIISEQLGMIASRLIRDCNLCGAVLTGGDIAYQTCQKLNVEALSILGEVEEGIPLCQVASASFENLPIVTKAGAFGKQQTLDRAVKKIQGLYDRK